MCCSGPQNIQTNRLNHMHSKRAQTKTASFLSAWNKLMSMAVNDVMLPPMTSSLAPP